MAKFPFTKMQAVGNDFVVVTAQDWPDGTDWNQTASILCDRHFGVGSDGLLVVLPSEIADFRMRMFNPDGTEDMCGNGLRCVIRYAADNQIFTGSKGQAETLDGLHTFSLNDGSDDDKPAGTITVDMASPKFLPAQIPVNTVEVPELTRVLDYPLRLDAETTVTISSVNTGSTHTVIWVEELPDDETFLRLSPLIENHPIFPERTSVLWTKVVDSESDYPIQPRLRLRIWERGAGETLGCGTGACAAAVLASAQDKIEEFIGFMGPSFYNCYIDSRGGTLFAEWWHPAGHDRDGYYNPGVIELTGTAQTVYSGHFFIDEQTE